MAAARAKKQVKVAEPNPRAVTGNNNPPINIEDFIPTPSVNQLSSVASAVNKAVNLEDQIESLEDALASLKAEYQVAVTKTLPEAMAQAGTEEFTGTGGLKVKLKKFLNGSIPKDPVRRKEAFAWLRAQQADDLIKFGISVEIDRGDAKSAKKVQDALTKIGVPFDSSMGVHPQTLAAFARELIEAGKPVPLETLGLYAGTVAKITRPKKKEGAPAVAADAAPSSTAQPAAKANGSTRPKAKDVMVAA